MTLIFEVSTAQVQSIKVLFETLQKLVTDTNWEIDHTGIRNTDTNIAQTVLIHVKLDANKFEHFFCARRIVIGVNMLVLHRIAKTIHAASTLCLFMEEEDPNHLGIRVENTEKNTTSMFKVNLLDLDTRMRIVDPITFDHTIVIPSSDFQKHIRDLSVVSDYVEIRNIDSELTLMARGDDYSMETTIRDIVMHGDDVALLPPPPLSSGQPQKEGEDDDEAGGNGIIQGEFLISYLVQFTHCTSISPMVEIMMRNNFPILLVYQVASLGTVKLALSQAMRK
jgi:proliferating cell nuclear antigen